MMYRAVAVERAGVVARDLALEPGTEATAEAVEQRVVALGETAVAIAESRRPSDIGGGPACFQIPGVLVAALITILPCILARQRQALHASIARRAQAVGLHAFALELRRRGVLLVDVTGADVGEPHRADIGHMLQSADIQLGLGLGTIIGFQPHKVAAPALLTAQTQHCGLVERLARGQVVGAATIEFAISQAIADVQRIAVDQETVADHNVLPTEGEIHAVLAERLEQFDRTPTEVGIFDLGGAFRAIGKAGGIAIAPGCRAQQREGAVAATDSPQPLVKTQTILEIALAPGRTTLL